MKLIEFVTEHESHILLWKIEEDAQYYIERLKLTSYDYAELDKFLVEKRKLQWYASRHTLKQILQTEEVVHLHKNEQGKPFIHGSELHLSLSHTNEITAAIANHHHKVGIDIEHIKEKVKRVSHKFTTAHELQYMTVENEVAYLITIWSAKESLYKLYGNKKLDFIEHIKLEPFYLQQEGVIQGRIIKETFLKDLVVHYRIIGDHVLTYVEDTTEYHD